jgi:hypothetical protein
MFYNDLKAIISSARVSIACVAKDKKLNTAYILIETDAPESLGKLYSMVGFLGLPVAELPGWESAVSTPIPNAGPLVQNAVLAHKKGAFLSGIGTVADFAKSPAIREEYKEFMSQDDIVNGIVSSKLYDVLLDMTQDLLAATPLGTSASDETAIATITAIRDSFDFICVKLSASGKGYEKYNFTKDGSLIEAMFKVISNSARQATGSAADPTE